MEHINNYISEHKDRFINELMDLLRIPSISADPAYADDVHACAIAVESHLLKAGADNVIMPDKVGGSHMASLVVTPDVVEFLDNISVEGTGDVNLEELTVSDFPEHTAVKTLRDLEARYKTGCTVIGFKSNTGDYVVNPGPDTLLEANSKLFVLGKQAQIRSLNELLNL